MDLFDDISTLLGEALGHHKAQRFDAALALYGRVLKLIPDHPDTTHLLGLCFHQLQRQSEATETLLRAVELSPSEPTYRNSLGLALKAGGHLDEAAAACEKAITLNATIAEFHNNLGSIRLAQKRYSEAGTSFRRALQLRPEHGSAHNNLGVLHAAEGRPDEAIACFERAVRYQPSHVQAWQALAGLIRGRKQYQRAIAVYEAAIRSVPNDAKLHLEHGKTLIYAEQLSSAAEALRRSVALDPELKEAHYMFAALGEAPTPAAVPIDYVAGLFDSYADKFESHLRGELAYRAPEIMLETLRRAKLPSRPLEILDGGCGTGLCGPLLRPLAARLDGVDLSSQMIRHAEKKGIYDELIVGDLLKTLADRPNRYDLIVAADVVIYLGDLHGLFVAAARALQPGGFFALSVEGHEGEGYVLQRSGRFAHSTPYVLSVAKESGLRPVIVESSVLRQENEKGVVGTVMVLQVT